MLTEQFYSVVREWLGQALRLDEMDYACILYAHLGYHHLLY